MPSLLYHNIKIAYRNIKRTAWYSILNISGLAVGMACSILIILWVQSELSYDNFHKNADNLYRAYQVQEYAGTQSLITDNLPGPLAGFLKEEFPEIENTARFISITNKPVKQSDKNFNERICFTDPNFFNMFDFSLKQGNKENVLSQPFSAVITEKIAKKYFNEENPVGKTLTIEGKYDFTVTGVLKDLPSNSHLSMIEILIPFSNTGEIVGEKCESWGNNWPRTYIQLKAGASVKSFEKKIENVLHKQQETTSGLHIQPISKIHLYTLTGESDFVKYLYIISAIGFALLLIACINFINLSTARSKLRSKEVGLRKVSGAQRTSLVLQFFGESILLTGIALILAVIIIALSLPSINNLLIDLTGTELVFNFFENQTLLLGIISITIFTGVVSGFYPAVYLSSFQPVQILKNNYAGGSNRSLFRNLLVVIQFTCSVVLIISTLIISSQLKYLKITNLGYNKNNIVYIPLGGDSKEKYETIKNEYLKSTDVLAVTATSRLPLSGGDSSSDFEWEGKDPEQNVLINMITGDPNYINVMGIKMVEGEQISAAHTFSTDEKPIDILVNENAVKRMNIKSPIGKLLKKGDWKGRIIGVVKDFHFSSFHKEIEPIIILGEPQYARYLLARLNENKTSNTIKYLEETWQKINPSLPVTYTFLDESINNLYNTETRISEVLKYFTFIAIFIACLGLLGLASFTSERYTKEIGIRKILGSSTMGIFILLTKEFVKWVVVANIIAFPAAYYLSNHWLQTFVYRVDIKPWIFLLSFAAALLITLITVAYHTIKAATANPVNSLRSE
ncbi:MAG: hypothetical protein A2068_09595 [Ignavibacteria bacterium GWB2_35_6b]|nr:MAG: hypothetical protein A2068_09595 [Ignavibacteria bacterium GWB2_35_6b]